ncbi:MAG: hypothetical protein HXX18_02010 [Bacteroidetes bacterium]|nr:hypothetical protein [Bacteroidota bacterium]
MKKIIIIGLFLLSISQIFAQNQSDSIEIKKTFFGTIFRQNGKNLTPQQLINIMQPNAEAYKEMKVARTNYSFGMVFSFAGGAFMGWPLGGAIAGKKMDWTLFGIGVGLTVISIPFSIAYTNHSKNAVRNFNNGLKQTGMNTIDLKLGITPDGIGITMALFSNLILNYH